MTDGVLANYVIPGVLSVFFINVMTDFADNYFFRENFLQIFFAPIHFHSEAVLITLLSS